MGSRPPLVSMRHVSRTASTRRGRPRRNRPRRGRPSPSVRTCSGAGRSRGRSRVAGCPVAHGSKGRRGVAALRDRGPGIHLHTTWYRGESPSLSLSSPQPRPEEAAGTSPSARVAPPRPARSSTVPARRAPPEPPGARSRRTPPPAPPNARRRGREGQSSPEGKVIFSFRAVGSREDGSTSHDPPPSRCPAGHPPDCSAPGGQGAPAPAPPGGPTLRGGSPPAPLVRRSPARPGWAPGGGSGCKKKTGSMRRPVARSQGVPSRPAELGDQGGLGEAGQLYQGGNLQPLQPLVIRGEGGGERWTPGQESRQLGRSPTTGPRAGRHRTPPTPRRSQGPIPPGWPPPAGWGGLGRGPGRPRRSAGGEGRIAAPGRLRPGRSSTASGGLTTGLPPSTSRSAPQRGVVGGVRIRRVRVGHSEMAGDTRSPAGPCGGGPSETCQRVRRCFPRHSGGPRRWRPAPGSRTSSRRARRWEPQAEGFRIPRSHGGGRADGSSGDAGSHRGGGVREAGESLPEINRSREAQWWVGGGAQRCDERCPGPPLAPLGLPAKTIDRTRQEPPVWGARSFRS